MSKVIYPFGWTREKIMADPQGYIRDVKEHALFNYSAGYFDVANDQFQEASNFMALMEIKKDHEEQVAA